MNIQMQTGFQLVEQGMSRALAHVEAIDDGWGERAYQFVRGFAALRTQFRTEEVRSYAEQRGLSSPSAARAWDGIIEKAARAGIIERIGFTTCENVKADRNNVSCWRGV
jgi:hypothetical protein